MLSMSKVSGILKKKCKTEEKPQFVDYGKCKVGKAGTKRGLKCLKKCEKRETYSGGRGGGEKKEAAKTHRQRGGWRRRNRIDQRGF